MASMTARQHSIIRPHTCHVPSILLRKLDKLQWDYNPGDIALPGHATKLVRSGLCIIS